MLRTTKEKLIAPCTSGRHHDEASCKGDALRMRYVTHVTYRTLRSRKPKRDRRVRVTPERVALAIRGSVMTAPHPLKSPPARSSRKAASDRQCSASTSRFILTPNWIRRAIGMLLRDLRPEHHPLAPRQTRGNPLRSLADKPSTHHRNQHHECHRGCTTLYRRGGQQDSLGARLS